MQWDQLIGHQQQKIWFQRALAKKRLASSFLFVGPDGIGKRTFARLLAKSLLCGRTAPDSLDACGSCEDCAQVDAGTHPDLIELAKPEGKSDLPLELLIGSPEKRMREGLCYEINLRPYGGRRKVAIIDDADFINQAGANSLLKTLEEPPDDSVMILIGSSLQSQLPTIRSRCQIVLFQPLTSQQLTELLVRQQVLQVAPSKLEIAELARSSGGSLTIAKQLADEQLKEFRDGLYALLSLDRVPLLDLAKSFGAVVDAAGKEAKPKRDRMKQIFSMTAEFYRSVLLELLADSPTGSAAVGKLSGDQEADSLIRLGRMLAGQWTTGVTGAIACWQCCLRAIEDVDKNANQASLLQNWTAQIAQLSGR